MDFEPWTEHRNPKEQNVFCRGDKVAQTGRQHVHEKRVHDDVGEPVDVEHVTRAGFDPQIRPLVRPNVLQSVPNARMRQKCVGVGDLGEVKRGHSRPLTLAQAE